MSDDLRYAVFFVNEPLTPQDTNNTFDVYVLDRQTSEYDLISRSTSGQAGNGLSMTSGGYGAISGDGRYVVFSSESTNLDGIDINGVNDVFIRDRLLDTTKRVSSDNLGNAGNGSSPEGTISADGSTVVYSTSATSLSGDQPSSHNIIMTNLITGVSKRLSAPQGVPDTGSDCGNPTASQNGDYVVFHCYTNLLPISGESYYDQIYRYDVRKPSLRFVSGAAYDINALQIDGDGQRVAYYDGRRQMYVWDAPTGQANFIAGNVQTPHISRDGNTVAAQDVSNGSRAGVWALPPLPEVPSDNTPPVTGSFTWSQNPKPTTATTTLTVPATDDSSGIQKAEYFIGDNDPGQGNGATMQLSNVQNGGLSADVTTTFGTDFPTGVYKISIRAQDTAGNWSDPVSDYLVVYDSAGPKMTGKRTIVPSLGNGDILPGLTSNSQTDKAQFGFSVKYNNQGQINGNSDLQFSYSTGTHCNNPNNAVNCHALSLNATGISWLTTQGTNNSTGIFQGTAALNVDGQASTVLFRVTGVDGERLSATANDQFQIAIYNSGSNPNTDAPLYRVNSADIARGNIKIQ
jgi:hypothetical protein